MRIKHQPPPQDYYTICRGVDESMSMLEKIYNTGKDTHEFPSVGMMEKANENQSNDQSPRCVGSEQNDSMVVSYCKGGNNHGQICNGSCDQKAP